LLVVKHSPTEGLGTLGPLLARHAYLETLAAHGDYGRYREEVERLVRGAEHDGLILLGGPMGVYERDEHPQLDLSLRLLRDALRRDIPILGLCLGAQLLALALGAQVWPGRTEGKRKEIGWYELELTERGRVDPALHGFSSGHPVFQWHGDTFALPEGAWLLARTLDYLQVFRWGRWAYGLQCHLELDEADVAEWMRAGAEEAAEAGVDPDLIREQTARHTPAMKAAARVLGDRFLECVAVSRGDRLTPAAG